MGPKRKAPDGSKKKSSPIKASSKSNSSSTKHQQQQQKLDLPESAGYLISCDIPTRQYIRYLNKEKAIDKKFILEDLDDTHLLIKL